MMRKQVDLVNQSLPAGDLLEAVHAVMHAVRAHMHRATRDDPQALTPMDAKVLGFFARHPGATQSDLVSHAGRDKGQVARLVAGLKERGLLEARADEADRRSVRLQLTAEGVARQQTLQRQRRRLAEQAVQGLGEAERTVLLQALQRICQNLDALP